MRIRQSPAKGNGADRGRKCTIRPQITALTLSSSRERLDYIAAMVQELKLMSAQADYRTLTGLLDLAYQEALQRRRIRQ
jgi:hypothetical protein